jgi:MFS transporter, DHA1 family, tetracycline resistance protein
MSDARSSGRAPLRAVRGAGRGLPPGFGVLWTTVAIDLLGFGIVVPLLPLYARHLGAGPASVGLLLAAFSAAQFVSAPLLGRLSDRVGRKPLLIVSLAGTALASLLTGVAGSLWLLVVARVLDGASGGSVAVAQASATDLVGPEDRTRVFGLLGAAYGVGFVIGPAIGGLAALGGTRVPFLVAAGIAAVNAGVALRRLPETRPASEPGSRPGSGPGHAPARRDRAPGALWGIVRTIAVPAVLTLVLVASFSAFEATFALFGAHRLGFDLATTGAVFAMVGVVSAVVQGGLVRPLALRLGDAGCLRIGLGAEAVGLVLLSTVHARVDLVLPLLLVTAGQGLSTPTLNALVVAKVGAARRGTALGVQQGLSSLARIVGPVLGGLSYALLGVGAPFVGGGLALVAALVFSLVMRAHGTISARVVVESGGDRLPLSNNG